ncbi:MAG: phage resistance protein, partial [Vicinamibacteraceae bacterium]
MTAIRELIDLPEQVHRGDFVLRLTEGVEKPGETLRDYVVTPQLVQCFDEALKFIRSALDANSSKAAYLHGSFGSGKSHFMAVLHLLLRNDPGARSIPELATIVDHSTTWTENRRFLLVPYHMIGARSMESAILGHYVAHVSRLHPEAAVPGVYKTEKLFADAERLRGQIGDEAFFRQLNTTSTAVSSGWGDVAVGWDVASFVEAQRVPPAHEQRTRLAGDLVQAFFSSYGDIVRGQEEAYVPLDIGLSAISTHAKQLRYDAVILFLDELILWLASHAADPAFISREGQKLAQLVEAQQAYRPIPIISFVARQRDLRDLVGEHVTGAEQLAFADVLKWWEARFHTITLEDRNLPAIAERRVLKPKSEAARQRMDEAFRETTQVRQEVMDTLLTSTADREMFRQVYPFSPALVQALVAVSSMLQRERTALKVMLQILVDQRDVLKLGDLVPVGDLFDVIAEGDEAFSEAMRIHFENATRLYKRKLLPMLQREYGLSGDQLRSLPLADPVAQRFRADGRLVKTLLLAALVPEVEAFKALTPARLAALNHGTIRTPIPGGEAREVARRVRNWAAQVGEIKISGEDANPTIAIQITGVDTESILEQARAEDNHGNRKRLLKELLFKELGIAEWDGLFI